MVVHRQWIIHQDAGLWLRQLQCYYQLTHWGRVTHICVSRLTNIGSDNGLPPDQRQAIIGTNAGILLIGPFGTNFSEILIEIYAYSFRKMHLKTSSGKWRPFCLGLNVFTTSTVGIYYLFISSLIEWKPHLRIRQKHSFRISSWSVKVVLESM